MNAMARLKPDRYVQFTVSSEGLEVFRWAEEQILVSDTRAKSISTEGRKRQYGSNFQSMLPLENE